MAEVNSVLLEIGERYQKSKSEKVIYKKKVMTINCIVRDEQFNEGDVYLDLEKSKSILSNILSLCRLWQGSSSSLDCFWIQELKASIDGCLPSITFAKVMCSPFSSSFTYPHPLDSCDLRYSLWSSSMAMTWTLLEIQSLRPYSRTSESEIAF